MNFGYTGTRTTRRFSRSPLRRASVRAVSRGVPDAFADAVVGARMTALTLVTPWLSDAAGGCLAFDRIMNWAEECDARVRLLTRRPNSNEAHERAIQRVLSAGGHVTVNPRLHAKIFVSEFANGGRTAVIGSANLTAGSYDLLEASLLVSSGPTRHGPDLVDDLLRGPISQITHHADSANITVI
jgi:hypothetical protein